MLRLDILITVIVLVVISGCATGGRVEGDGVATGGTTVVGTNPTVTNNINARVGQLVEDLKSESPARRRAAAIELGDIGPDARAARSALQALAASDPDPGVRREAKRAVEHIQ